MIIVGRDFHPSWQQVAVLDSATGEIRKQKVAGQRDSVLFSPRGRRTAQLHSASQKI